MEETGSGYLNESALQEFARVRVVGSQALRSLMRTSEVEQRSHIMGYDLLGAVSVGTEDHNRPWEEFVLFQATRLGVYTLAFAATHAASRPATAIIAHAPPRSVTVIPIDELAKLVQLNYVLEAADTPPFIGALQEPVRRSLRMRVVDRNTEATFGRKQALVWPELGWDRISRGHFTVKVNRLGMTKVIDQSVNGTYVRQRR